MTAMLRHRRIQLLALVQLAVAATGLTSAVLVGAGDDAPPTRIMPLGDSITHGEAVPGGYRIDLFAALTSAGHAFDFVGSQANGPPSLPDQNHEGHRGFTIDGLSVFVDRWLEKTSPDVVLLMVGTNDILQGLDLDGAPRRLGALLDRITTGRPAAAVLVATLPPIGEAAANRQVQTFNASLLGIVASKTAEGRHIRLVDIDGAVAVSHLSDGIHPTLAGFATMAAAWHVALQAVLPPATER